MKVLYVRISTIQGQKTDRQKTNEESYDWVIEDKVTGIMPFFKRPGGQQILELMKKNSLSRLTVHSIDRMFRDAKDMMITLEVFNEAKIPVHFISQGLCTLDEDGKQNPITSMVIHIMGIFAQANREYLKIMQAQGIAIARAKGLYKGRKVNTKEDTLTFLSKPKQKRALELLKQGLKCSEVADAVGLHPNTITKVKKRAGLSEQKSSLW